MFVGTSRQPIDTERFIHLHDAALHYFGGAPQECVYDQTRLVVQFVHWAAMEQHLTEWFDTVANTRSTAPSS